MARAVLVGETRASWSRDWRAAGRGLRLLRSSGRRRHRHGARSLHLPGAGRGRVAGHGEVSAGKYYPRAANKHRGRFTSGEPDETLSDRVDEFVGYELVEMLDGSGIPYVLVDPPPVDEPIPEGLRIEPTLVFAEGLGRLPLEEMKKGRA